MLFVLSVAVGHLLTMLDGLALFLALAPAAGARRVGLAFATAQAACVGLAFALATLGAELMSPHHAGWLGLGPIALGVWALGRRWSGGAEEAAAPVVAAPFAGLGST